MRTIEISQWKDFLGHLVPRDGFRSWLFRGQADARWPLVSSLTRYLTTYGLKDRTADWPALEARILRVFKRKAHLLLSHVPRDDDDFQWLAIMQHHGAPTRLLDFTWSPWVAAFFALERSVAEKAAVWAIHPKQVRDTYASDANDVSEYDLRQRSAYAEMYLHNQKSFVWQGEPMVVNQRLNLQQGTFLVPSRLDVTLENLVDADETSDRIVRFVLDVARLRNDAMAMLYDSNITRATLFPDLDGLATSLAYELEWHWAYDPKTGAEYPGLDGDPASRSTDTRLEYWAAAERVSRR